MTLPVALFAYLSAQSAITALVGFRIYPLARPQATALPAIVYRRVTTERFFYQGITADQYSAASVIGATVAIDCYGETFASADAVSEAVKAALIPYRGTMGTLKVTGVFEGSTQDILVVPADGSSPGDYLVSTDYRLKFS